MYIYASLALCSTPVPPAHNALRFEERSSYTDSIRPDLDPEDAMELLLVANQFGIHALERLCEVNTHPSPLAAAQQCEQGRDVDTLRVLVCLLLN